VLYLKKGLLIDVLEFVAVAVSLSIGLFIVFSGMEIAVAEIALGAFFLVVFLLASTDLIKKHADSQSFWVISIVRFKKTIPLIKKFFFAGKFLRWCSIAGLILGFGVIAVDFLYARKAQGKGPRIAILTVSFILLYALYSAVNFFVPLSASPFGVGFSSLFPLAFALFGFSGFAIAALADQGFHILFRTIGGEPSCPGIMPVIPGVSIPKAPIFIPAYVWIVLLIIVSIHELSHGVVALWEKIRLKSAGLLLAGLFPVGAFVEMDEKQLATTSDKKQLLVYSAGASANLASMVPFLVIWIVLANFYMAPVLMEVSALTKEGIDHLEIVDVSEEIVMCQEKEASPSLGVLEKGMRVLGINGVEIGSVEDFVNVMNPIRSDSLKSGASATFTITVETAEGKIEEKEITLSERFKFAGFTIANINKEGFSIPEHYIPQLSLMGFINGFLLWLLMFSFLLAVVNFLPVPFFDGGKIVPILLLPYFASKRHPEEKTKKAISTTLLLLMAFLMVLNALPFFTF